MTGVDIRREPIRGPLQVLPTLGSLLGMNLAVQRDDLLPFPLASSKVRGIDAELTSSCDAGTVLVSNGSVDSNHCRTLAMWAAERGIEVNLVLHGERGTPASERAVCLYDDLGAKTEIVAPDDIAPAIVRSSSLIRERGKTPLVIPGGCHTPRAAIAHRDAAAAVFRDWRPDVVFVPSGTGAIQGGLVAAASVASPRPRVIGISVARNRSRGIFPVTQAAEWAGAAGAEIEFDDEYLDGGYTCYGRKTMRAVNLGWSNGLPLDPTYTGKAFRALIDYGQRNSDPKTRVLFWHTGGLWNYLQQQLF